MFMDGEKGWQSLGLENPRDVVTSVSAAGYVVNVERKKNAVVCCCWLLKQMQEASRSVLSPISEKF